jgi:hypothetical protein
MGALAEAAAPSDFPWEGCTDESHEHHVGLHRSIDGLLRKEAVLEAERDSLARQLEGQARSDDAARLDALSSLRLCFLAQTGFDSPSEWEGEAEDGRWLYVRYRHGRLRWGLGDDLDLARQDAFSWPGIGFSDSFDGCMGQDEMLGRLGLA